ncbi:isoleucine--tRNA ligase, mitochondrial [Lutzomyia longipalpis]|uniref:isoleucine--tRNA ligase, mitochondrial n=1 Tax=Lutzomyia longipalpis TaxID=7200 RepID=UPI0024837DB1|nr:isoleucine--tRNA ligase, mitochondrial [Lutzomyia longipalpis]
MRFMFTCGKVFRNVRNWRYFSAKCEQKAKIKYTDTINLPKTQFPARLDPKKRNLTENEINERCFRPLYRWQEENLQSPAFVLHDGPPYANGDLHMGHAINKILKDVTIHHHIIRGRKVHYIPGWDCHGLPIELKALTGDTSSADPVAIRKKAREFALKTIQKQKAGFQAWGIAADWANDQAIYRTTSPEFIANQMRIFFELFSNGLIYRDLKPVYWSPSSKTALAEAELEYDSNFKSPSLYVRFRIENKLPEIAEIVRERNLWALVWTTTPWTLLSNQAVCFSEQLEYCLVGNPDSPDCYIIALELLVEIRELFPHPIEILGKIETNLLHKLHYQHPILEGSEKSFLPASHVSAAKGTGLVHTAPAHGFEDFLVGIHHKLPTECFVDELGNYTNESPEFLRKKNVLQDGTEVILKYLQEKELVVHLGEILHAYPIDWRTKQPIIIRASDQWFINTDKIKEKAIEEVQKVNIFPRITSVASKNLLIAQLQKRPYWCISRQRAWGVPIPVFYGKSSKKVITSKAIVERVCEEILKMGNVDFWWEKSVQELVPEKHEEELEKGMDILDIWFDSGITWSHVLQGEKVADLYLEGIDQFTGWFQSSLMTSVALRKRAPYKSIFVHGFVLDEKGQKMSKSLGNVIHPKDIVKKYGVDTMRWWIAAHGTQHTSILLSENILQASAENVQKIRGIFRYLIGICGSLEVRDFPEDLTNFTYLDRFFLSKLWEFHDAVFSMYDAYEYNRVATTIVNFIANDVSSIYIHLTKDRLYCGTDAELQCVQQVMNACFLLLAKALWPILPFLVEECWSHCNANIPFYHINVGTPPAAWEGQEAREVIEKCLQFKEALNRLTPQTNTWKLDVDIHCNPIDFECLKKLQPECSNEESFGSQLSEVLQVSRVRLTKIEDNADFRIHLSTNESPLCPRCRRFATESGDGVCRRCDWVLRTKSRSGRK